MKEGQIVALVDALDERNHKEFYDCVAKFTPNELVSFQSITEHKDFVYMLWSASATWGFEVLWAEQYSLPEVQRDPDVDLPELTTLTPDKPLGKHFM